MTTQITLHKFGKPGCQPCKVLGYVLEGERRELAALGVTIVEHDITQEPELIAKYDLTSVPVMVFERNGHVMGRINGICNMAEIYDAVAYAKTAK